MTAAYADSDRNGMVAAAAAGPATAETASEAVGYATQQPRNAVSSRIVATTDTSLVSFSVPIVLPAVHAIPTMGRWVMVPKSDKGPKNSSCGVCGDC